MWRKALTTAAAASMLVLVTAAVAGANGGVAMSVDVANSRQTVVDSASGKCTWEVGSSITIVNLTDQSQTIDSVGYSVSWTSPNDSGVQSSITVVNNGGLVPGVTLGANERRTFSPLEVRFVIPCTADFGDLAVRIQSALGTGSGDAPFLEGGTPVPPGAVGLAILAALLSVQLIASHRRQKTLSVVRAA